MCLIDAHDITHGEALAAEREWRGGCAQPRRLAVHRTRRKPGRIPALIAWAVIGLALAAATVAVIVPLTRWAAAQVIAHEVQR